jgi:hypothetical protein
LDEESIYVVFTIACDSFFRQLRVFIAESSNHIPLNQEKYFPSFVGLVSYLVAFEDPARSRALFPRNIGSFVASLLSLKKGIRESRTVLREFSSSSGSLKLGSTKGSTKIVGEGEREDPGALDLNTGRLGS